MADGAGDGHTDEHQRHGNHLIHIVEVDPLQTLEHQDAHVDQSSGGGSGGDDGSDGGDEDAGQEQQAGDNGGQTGAAASFNAGSGLDEGGDGGSTGAGAGDGTDSVGQQGFLHVGHIALLVHHTGAGGGANQSADGVEHINDAEGDDKGNSSKPADLHEAGEVELEQGDLSHISEGGQEGSGRQILKGVGVQEHEGTDPANNGSDEHTEQHGALDAFLGHGQNGEQADEHSHDSQNHIGETGIAHIVAQEAGRQGGEEVAHHIEGAAILSVNTCIGAKADVHQHQADGGRDAQTDAERNGLDDLFTDVEDGQDNEENALKQDDDQSGLERGHISHTGHGNDVADNYSEEAVQTHTGSHCEGLVGHERHAERTNGRGNAGCQKHTVPQFIARGTKTGEQVRVQRDDVGHRHECREASHDLSLDGGLVLGELENFL